MKEVMKEFDIDREFLLRFEDKEEKLEVNKQNLERFIMLSSSFRYHPMVTADICKKFNLNYEKIRNYWFNSSLKGEKGDKK